MCWPGPPTTRTSSSARPAAPEAVSVARGLWNLFSRPTSVLAVCDTSASMAQVVPGTHLSRLEMVRRAMSGALSAFQAQDHLGLWEFSTRLDGNRDYREVVPLGPLSDRVVHKGDGVVTSRAQALQDGFAGLRP